MSRAVPDARYLEPERETLPRAQLEALQQERILELVPWAYARSGLYRETWDAAGVHPRDIRSLDDFRERIPFISKDSIRAYRDRHGDPFGGLLCVEPAELTSIMSSSGTTGDATFFPERWERCPPLPTSMARDLWELGVRPGDYVLGAGAGTFRGRVDAVHQLLGAIPLALGSWADHGPDLLDAIRRYRPVYLPLVGPVLVELEHLGQRHDLREAFACFKAASFAGEPLGARMRARICDDWGLELFLWTSAGDTGTSWECRAHDGCHLWEDTVLAEHVDPAGDTPAPDGAAGELVTTSIDHPIAPLIRYRTDDLVRLTRRRCACGRTHARQWPIGRKGDETLVQGRPVLPLDVWAAIERIDETATALFQIIRPARELDALRIRVGYDAERARNLADLEQRIRAAVYAAVGIEPELELVTEQEILARASSAAKLPRVSRS